MKSVNDSIKEMSCRKMYHFAFRLTKFPTRPLPNFSPPMPNCHFSTTFLFLPFPSKSTGGSVLTSE